MFLVNYAGATGPGGCGGSSPPRAARSHAGRPLRRGAAADEDPRSPSPARRCQGPRRSTRWRTSPTLPRSRPRCADADLQACLASTAALLRQHLPAVGQRHRASGEAEALAAPVRPAGRGARRRGRSASRSPGSARPSVPGAAATSRRSARRRSTRDPPLREGGGRRWARWRPELPRFRRNEAEHRYVVRCVKACTPARGCTPAVVSPATPSRLRHLDAGCPRPVRISLPVDVLVAAPRKSPRSVASSSFEAAPRADGAHRHREEVPSTASSRRRGRAPDLGARSVARSRPHAGGLVALHLPGAAQPDFWWLPFVKVCFLPRGPRKEP